MSQPSPFVTTDTVLLFGKSLHKKVSKISNKPIGVYVDDQHIIFNSYTSNAARNQALERFLKTTARAYILPRLEKLAGIMKTSYNQVRFKEQKTRWGSCSSQRNLNFNWRLVHAPPEVIDYVLIHELAHLTHMNHSHRFWQLVARYDPDHKAHRGWLNRHGVGTG